MKKLFPYLYDVKVLTIEFQSFMKHCKVNLKALYKSMWNPKIL